MTNREDVDAEDRMIRAMLAEQDAKWEAHHATYTQRMERLLAEERQHLAQDRLERQAEQVETYRQSVVATATANKTVAPQLLDFITGSTKEEIDNAAHLAAIKTAEILAEVADQQPYQDGFLVPPQALGAELADQYLPQGLTAAEQQAAEDGSLSMQDYAQMRQRLGLGHLDNGLFN